MTRLICVVRTSHLNRQVMRAFNASRLFYERRCWVRHWARRVSDRLLVASHSNAGFWPLCKAWDNGLYEKFSRLGLGRSLDSGTLSAVRTSHALGLRQGAVRRAGSGARLRRQTPAATPASEDEPSIDGQFRPGSANNPRAGPRRSGELMASEGCRCTEVRKRLRGVPGGAAAELAIIGANATVAKHSCSRSTTTAATRFGAG